MQSRSLLRIPARAIGELRAFNSPYPQYGHQPSVRTKGTKHVERFGKCSSYACQLNAFTDTEANMTVIDDI